MRNRSQTKGEGDNGLKFKGLRKPTAMDFAGVEWQVDTHGPTVRNKAYNCPESIRSCGGCPRSAHEGEGKDTAQLELPTCYVESLGRQVGILACNSSESPVSTSQLRR